MHTLLTKKTKCILTGDFNINLLNNNKDSETENFLNILLSHQLIPTITKPTRYTDHSSTLIDNIITNCVTSAYKSGVILTDISDHLPAFFFLESKFAKSQEKIITRTTRIINDTNIHKLMDSLEHFGWSYLNLYTADDAYDSFITTFTKAYNDALPLSTRKIKLHCGTYKPWITGCILKSMKKKHRLYKKALISKTPMDNDKYKKI